MTTANESIGELWVRVYATAWISNRNQWLFVVSKNRLYPPQLRQRWNKFKLYSFAELHRYQNHIRFTRFHLGRIHFRAIQLTLGPEHGFRFFRDSY
jgi:hypothetical protein